MKYRLTVSYPLNVGSIRHDTERVEKLVGRRCCGSGAGFGMRDVEFEFDRADERNKAINRLGRRYQISTSQSEP